MPAGWADYDIGDHVNKFGYNPSIDSATPEDVLSAGGLTVWPSVAAALTIVSTSANDAAAGTGARTVKLLYLDANYKQQIATVTLNGLTAVSAGVSAIRCDRAFVMTAGSGGSNAGNLSIKIGASTVTTIPANEGQTLKAAFTIPADYSQSYLRRLYASIPTKTAASAIIRLKIRPFGGAWRTWRIIGASSSAGIVEEVFERSIASHVEPKWDIVINADVSGNGIAVAAGFDLELRR